MLDKVKKYIGSKAMISPGDVIVAGVSGGADSVCLLWLLNRLRAELDFQIVAVHVNHGLRGCEADRDQEFVRQLCEGLKIPCRFFAEDVRALSLSQGVSEEEAGRKLRYQCFYEVLNEVQGDRIAVAHHRDDKAETVLFHLFRGSGFRGLSGIQEVRDQIIRPLLCCNREEIEGLLVKEGITWQTDTTNLENEYTRNKIRNELIPFVRENINCRAVDHILGAAELFHEADDYFTGIAMDFCGNHVRVEENKVLVQITPFKALKPIIQRYVVRICYQKLTGSLRDFTAVHNNQVIELLEMATGKQSVLPNELVARRSYEELVFERQEQAAKGENPVPDLIFKQFPYRKEAEIPKNMYTKWFDYAKIQGTLIVRTREEGDYLLLSDGGRKTIKSYMIDQKIPRELRNRIWLLADGQHILWILGYRISEGCKITNETREILQVQWRNYNGR